MKFFYIFLLLFFYYSSILGQSTCLDLFRQGSSAVNSADVELALKKLKDLETCDYKDVLNKERLYLRGQIFDFLRKNRDELSLLNKENSELIKTLREEQITKDSLLDEFTAIVNNLASTNYLLLKEKKYSDSILNITILEKERNRRIIDNLYFYKNKFGLAFNGKKFGFIDKNGEISLPFIYSFATPFSSTNGLSTVTKENGGLKFLIDTNGIESQYATTIGELRANDEFEVINISSPTNYSTFPEELLFQYNTKSLTMDNFGIKNIPLKFKYLSKIERISIRNHSLTTIPKSVSSLPNLKELSLPAKKDRHKEKSPFWFFGFQLNRGFFSRSELVRGSQLVSLTNLEHLDLSGWRIQSVPVEICQLSKLKYLNLSDTDISSLPACMQEMSSLKRIDITVSPLAFKEISIEVPSLIKNEILNNNF